MTSDIAPSLPKRLHSVQALRGIAALLVLFFHLAAFQRQMAGSNSADISFVSGLWDQGWAGVDLFFVISGFIMVYVTRDTGNSVKDVRRFIVSRITRIYPLWWVCAGIMAGYFWITYGIPAAPDRIAETGEAFSYALKSLLLIPQGAPPLLGLGWTLIHEMFFYIVFAGLLFLPRKYLLFALIIWGAITVFVAQLFAAPIYCKNLIELMTSPLTLEFIVGGFVGYCVIRGWFFKPRLLLLIGVILTALGIIAFPHIAAGNHTAMRVAVFLLPFSCLTYGWVCCELKNTLKPPKWLSHLGDWSYSLYLTHYIVLVAMRRLYRLYMPEDLYVGAPGVLDNILFAGLALLLSIVTASIFYRFIERPSLCFVNSLRA